MTRRTRGALALAAAVSVLSGVVCTGSAGGVASSRSRGLRAPLATSVSTTLGTWATVPMGNLRQRLNTFWQLFYLGPSASSWVNQVEATATATNGGLVLGGAAGPTMVVGVRPSNELRYSPLIETEDGGRSWSNGLVFPGLADVPDALAFDRSGRALALATDERTTEVLSSDAGMSHWRRLVSEGELARSAGGRRCGLVSIDAVGFLGTDPVLGVGCARHVAGVLRLDDGRWVSFAPALPRLMTGRGVDTLSIFGTSGHSIAIILGSVQHGDLSLTAAWRQAGQKSWTDSKVLHLQGERLTSIGAIGSGGIFVLTGHSGSRRTDLHLLPGAAQPWASVPAPPDGTSTVAVAPTGQLEALAVDGATLRVWELAESPTIWKLTQLVHVAVQFGSSG